jgi:isopentenyl-diphosphate delta-isomerase
MSDMVILVDENDKEIGTEEKMKAHEEGVLHRAFSVFVFNSKGGMLLQQRARSKYHSGGLWTNTCCSHPRPGETVEHAAHRRLKEEMGFDCNLKEIAHFIYKAQLDHDLTEHEFDHVFVGRYDEDVNSNQDEVEDVSWVRPDDLKKDIDIHPERYTEWFKIAFKKFSALSEKVIPEKR